jgi:hypothetical protein
MATELPTTTNGATTNGDASNQQSVKEGLARMLKGGVIMDVVDAEQVRTTSYPIPSLDLLLNSHHRLASPKKPAQQP